jgi:class 3 adenylate cyclase
MSLDAQSVPRTTTQNLLNGSFSSDEGVNVRVPDWSTSRVEDSKSLGELPAIRGESAFLEVLQRGASRPDTASASAKPAVAEVSRSERALLTLVFTDIVASTETLERVGDRMWCLLLLHHHELVRGHLKAHRGREIDAAGDGFFLVFDRPSQAVQFAVAVRRALKEIGIDLRVGVHAGECEVVSRRVEGVAVHMAARVASAAAAGEILVSSTVRDLVAGSEHRFSKKDDPRVLKGLSEPRQLYRLDCSEEKTA